MKLIDKEVIIEFVEKKSRFIGYAKPINSVKKANDYIDSIKKMHSTATHNVPVYRVIENGQEYFKYNDDGEPVGTAAKPMADIIERREVYNIAMVAVRYFGGIKLGAGGLIRNYARVSKELIDASTLIDYIEKIEMILIFDYSKKGILDKYIKECKAQILEVSYLEKINVKILISKDKLNEFKNIQNIQMVEL